MICIHCNYFIETIIEYCPNCGKKIDDNKKDEIMSVVNEFRNRNIFLMIILSIITLGVYNLYWFKENISILNKLPNSKKIHGVFGWIAFLTIFTALSLVVYIMELTGLFSFNLKAITDLADSTKETLFTMTLVVGYYFKWNFENIFKHTFKRNVNLSGVPLYFFSIFYIQYKINSLVPVKSIPQRL